MPRKIPPQGRPLLSNKTTTTSFISTLTTTSTITLTTTFTTSTSTTFSPQKILLPSPPQQMDLLSPQQEQYLKKQRRPYKIPFPRSQSSERAQPSSLARTPSLPSLSPSEFQSKELFPAIFSSPLARKKTPSHQEKTINWTNSTGSGFVLSRAGSSGGLPASKGTKAAAEL